MQKAGGKIARVLSRIHICSLRDRSMTLAESAPQQPQRCCHHSAFPAPPDPLKNPEGRQQHHPQLSAVTSHFFFPSPSPQFSSIPQVVILPTCLWLHSIHKPSQRIISQFWRNRLSPNAATSEQISQNKESQ